MNYIINKSLKGNLKYKNTIILTYQINYPEIIVPSSNHCSDSFNNFNLLKAIKLENYCKNELFLEAKNTFDYNAANGYPVRVYEVVLNYEITYNSANIVSLYSDEYKFTGGAHGNTIRKSQNWDLILCKFIPLSYFFPNDPYYIINILKQINSQISILLKDDPNIYFSNYCELTLDTFNLNQYYITSTGLVVFFQQYDIAPYSTGIPSFNIQSNFHKFQKT